MRLRLESAAYLLCDACNGVMLGSQLMDDVEQFEAVCESPVTCQAYNKMSLFAVSDLKTHNKFVHLLPVRKNTAGSSDLVEESDCRYVAR